MMCPFKAVLSTKCLKLTFEFSFIVKAGNLCQITIIKWIPISAKRVINIEKIVFKMDAKSVPKIDFGAVQFIVQIHLSFKKKKLMKKCIQLLFILE